MKQIPQFTDYFLTDLFTRAQMTLKKAAESDFEKIEQFTLKTLRKVMEGAPLLDPLNLLFLREKVFELGGFVRVISFICLYIWVVSPHLNQRV